MKEKEPQDPGAGERQTPPADWRTPSGEGSSAGKKAPSGVEKLPPEEIMKRSRKALTSVTTVRISTPDGGLDVTTDRSGNCAGKVTVEEYTTHLIKKGDEAWLKPEDAYWNDAAAKPILAKMPEVRGKYLHGTTKASFTLGVTTMFCQVGQMQLAGDFGALDNSSASSKGAVTTVNGQKAVPLHFDSPKEGRSTVYIATEGRPYPVRMESDAQKAQMGLSDLGRPFTPPASPPARDTVDAAEVEELSLAAD
ncbi:hypothetical protein [Streptomyces cyaneofuscatus]|uniref:hypothetical protein n=1 Tax=Streptomyces cyaneofuscatus TaxID=66883 RepID=UPI003414E172